MESPPTREDLRLLWDYVFFHLHSPLNSAQDDYRHFNHVLFNTFKLNFMYTSAMTVAYYHLLFSSKRGLLRGFVSPRHGILMLLGYETVQYVHRVRCTLYRPEAVECARKYTQDVERFNDHYHRMYGNER